MVPVAHEVAVAAAESAAFEATEFDALITRAELQRAFDAATGSEWWVACFAGSPPALRLVTPPARTQTSTARRREGGFEIRVAAGQLNRSTLAHELAHVLAGIDAAHGPLFRRAFVDVATMVGDTLIGEWLGAAFAGFDLAVADRRWPAPWSASGPGFVLR